MPTLLRLRKFVWLLRKSRYSREFGWYTPTPDGSRLARRKFLIASSFHSLVTLSGVRVPLEGLDDLDTTVDIFYARHYEPMKASIRPGTILVDIGANLAVTSLIFAQLDDIDHVYAYEPMPHTYQCAERSLSSNPNLAPKITLEPFGIGASDDEFEIEYTEKAKAAIGISPIPDRLVKRYGLTSQDMKRITIRVADADRILRQIMARHPGAPIALKIDAEGAEYGIIDRLSQTGSLKNVSYAAIEWHFTPGPEYITSRLEASGFRTSAKILEPDNSIGMIDAWR
jgi:FkbM family methyltransferase